MSSYKFLAKLEQMVKSVDKSCQRLENAVFTTPELVRFGPLIVRHEIIDDTILKVQATTFASMPIEKVEANIAEINQLNAGNGIKYTVNEYQCASCETTETVDEDYFDEQIHRLRKRVYRAINQWCKYCTSISSDTHITPKPYRGVDYFDSAEVGLDEFKADTTQSDCIHGEIDLIEFVDGPMVGQCAFMIEINADRTIMSMDHHRLIQWHDYFDLYGSFHRPEVAQTTLWLISNPYRYVDIPKDVAVAVNAVVAGLDTGRQFKVGCNSPTNRKLHEKESENGPNA